MLFWATLALGLFYLAHRYNVLFVTDTEIDTRGLFYPRALQHLFFGIYLAEICMVGMFAVSRAPGPATLMAAFLVFTILYHIALNRSLGPLLSSLPRTLYRKEQLIRTSQDQASNGSGGQRGNFLTRFFRPWVYADYEALRDIVPQGNTASSYAYSEKTLAHAYLPPSVTSTPPVLWIPEDKAGESKHEIDQTKPVIYISDQRCRLDENNRIQWIQWDTEGARPPIWEKTPEF
jgi:calcium permeable stress-gated cation channel